MTGREKREQRAAEVARFLGVVAQVDQPPAPANLDMRRRLSQARHCRPGEPVSAPTPTSPTDYWGRHRRTAGPVR